MIGLEPWESLRYHNFFSVQTVIWANTKATALFSERVENKSFGDPVEILNKLENRKFLSDYSEKAFKQYSDYRMMNYLIGKDIVRSGMLPFTENEYIRCFIEEIKPEKRIELMLINELS